MLKIKINETIEDTKEYLLSWDCEPTNKRLIKCFNIWIDNLYSHIGTQAHIHELECGIEDETNLSWEEQDKQALNQINIYKKCIKKLENEIL